ncbi:DUF262 domain-containing protein [Helicobacter pylori]|uniref:DUF262 domain-containing protein n=1 Tax=Helicobacter pylori TaxID=210 RepID=UPI001E4B8B4A|nr:DUF1524 domain-containing protein [Helicobacter pylori]
MELLDLDGVIEKGVFEIPSYQRGYAWQERQLKDFWNDLEHVSKLGKQFHYMHSLTLREIENEFENSAFEIIDGQQRLATSLILLGLLAKTTQNKDPKYSLINLEPILSYKYYGLREAFRAITEEEKDLEAFKTSFYAKNLIETYEFFQEKISDTPIEALEKIDDLLFYLSYSSKVWNFLHTLDEKSITLIVDDNKKLEIEITPKMRSLLEKMRRLNALSDNAFLPLLLSLLTIQRAGKSANEQPYTTKELEGLLEHLERFGFLIYGVAGKNTAKNEWIELAFEAFRAFRYGEENIVIEKLPTLEKSFFNRQGNSGLELLEESILSKKNTEKWYKWGKALNYLLYEYELHHNPETTLNFDSSLESIEHILPQNPDQGYSAKEKNWAKNPNIVHALGNLLLIPKNANSSLSNKPFDEKRKEYLKGSYSEKEVAKNASFGVEQIKERSEKLLDFLIAHYRIAELVGESAIKAFKNASLKDIK